MKKFEELKELELHEVEDINGGGWLSDVGHWIGGLLNTASSMQTAADQARSQNW